MEAERGNDRVCLSLYPIDRWETTGTTSGAFCVFGRWENVWAGECLAGECLAGECFTGAGILGGGKVAS